MLKILKSSTRGDLTIKVALLKQQFQCAIAVTRARAAAAQAKSMLGGVNTFNALLLKRATGVVLFSNFSYPKFKILFRIDFADCQFF